MSGMQVLRMFHKKIHPERANAEEELKKSRNCESNKNSIAGGCNKGGLPSHDNYKSRSPLKAIFKKETTSLNVTHTGLSSSGMNEKREHWIKTDADCEYIPTTFTTYLVNIPVSSNQQCPI